MRNITKLLKHLYNIQDHAIRSNKNYDMIAPDSWMMIIKIANDHITVLNHRASNYRLQEYSTSDPDILIKIQAHIEQEQKLIDQKSDQHNHR